MIDYAYGHMGIVLYHKKMVLDATEWGPDFTCSFPVKLIDQISNIANYFQTEFFKSNSQPYYVLLSPDGHTILVPPVGYTKSISDFELFLKAGLKAFKSM